MASKPPRPVAHAILIADQVIKEAGTNKYTLVGIFNRIYATRFPCDHHKLALYLKFSDALGDYRLEVQLVDLTPGGEDLEKVLANVRGGFQMKDRLGQGEVALVFPVIRFPHPGKYEFRALANDDVVGVVGFEALLVPVRPAEGPVDRPFEEPGA